MTITRAALFTVVLALALPLSRPAWSQTTAVQNGGTLQVQNGGTWDLETGTMDVGEAGATARLDERTRGRVAGGTLRAVRSLSGPDAVNVAGLGAELSASADLGAVTVTRGHAVQVATNGNESIRRYFVIEPAGTNDGLDATLRFHYAEEELNGRSATALELFKSTDGGDTWSERGYSSRSADARTVTLSGIDSFGRWTLGSEDAPLPVEIASIDATLMGDAVRLSWQTASETGNAEFQIQRRVGGAGSERRGGWETIGRRRGAGTTTEAQRYRFADENLPYDADRLAYRLRQVDADGAAHLSTTVSVQRDVRAVQLLGTYPNPVRRRATVRYALPDALDLTLSLYNVLGQQVRTIVRGTQEGRQEQTLDVSGLPSGVYFLRLRTGTETLTRRLTVVQ